MKTHLDNKTDLDPHNTNNQPHDGAAVCAEVGSKLPAYIVNVLDEDAAFEVEQHLADCNYCKDKYLLVLRVQREAALRGQNNSANNGAGALSNESLGSLEVGNHLD